MEQDLTTKQGSFWLDEDLHLDRFITAEADRFKKGEPDFFLPVGNELSIDYVGTIEVDGIPQMIHFTGIIDRIFKNPDGSLHIHELKTGLWKDKP